MANGTVRWSSQDEGYELIIPDEHGKDLFVHHTAVVGNGFRSLIEGVRVPYAAELSANGPQAVKVQQL
jgi:cold shock protein